MEFIGAITQHIPEKSFQLVRYYGWYSNRGRGERDKKKQAVVNLPEVSTSIEIIDVSQSTGPPKYHLLITITITNRKKTHYI